MSSRTSGNITTAVILILLTVSGSLGGSVSVYCESQTICALRESAVNLICSYPQIKFSIKAVFWFKFKQKTKWRIETRPEDLALNSDYTGRVTTENKNSSSTLTIRDLRERDSGEYHIFIITEQGEKHLSSAAVTLTVTDLKVEIDRTTPTLFCRTSCSLTSGSQSYIWYRNGQKLDIKNENQDSLVVSSVNVRGSYSCSVSSHEEIRSNAVCVSGKCWSVTYSERRVCALVGSSVDFSCTYSYPPRLTVNERFWHYSWFDKQTQDLLQEQQFAGRVEFIEDKERNTLRMRGVRKSDSGEYYFQLISKTPEVRFSGKPGVILNVTDLQVRVISSSHSEEQTVTLMCSSTCTLPNNPTYIWYKNRQPVTNKPTRDNKLDLKCSEDAGSYSCAVRGHEELRSPDQTLCAGGPDSSVLTLITVGVVVFLALILITLWRCCVIRRKRGAERDTDIQTPDPADPTYTALNPTTMSSDYDTLQCRTDSLSDTYAALNPETMCSDYDTLTCRTDSPIDTYTALNAETMCSDYDTLTCRTDSPIDTYTALNAETMCSDYDTLTVVTASNCEQQKIPKRRISVVNYDNVQRPSPQKPTQISL